VKASGDSSRRSRRNESTAMSADFGGQGRVGRCGDASGREVEPGQNPGEETKPTEGEGGHQPATVEGRYGPNHGARPRGRGSPSEPLFSDRGERGGTTTRGQRSAVMPNESCGNAVSCGWGDFFEGCEVRHEDASASPEASEYRFTDAARQAVGRCSKRGEPLPVPGCNKPGTPV
jgi:hypothetical protein